MATTNNTIELQAALDKAQSVKNINKDIDKIKKQIKPLEIQVKPEAKSLQGLDGIKKEMEGLFREMLLNISEAISGSVSSHMSTELEKAESSTNSSLSNILNIWTSFGNAVEKTLKSGSIASGFNSLLSLVSALNDATKGTLGSLGTAGLGAGLFGITKSVNYFVKNFA